MWQALVMVLFAVLFFPVGVLIGKLIWKAPACPKCGEHEMYKLAHGHKGEWDWLCPACNFRCSPGQERKRPVKSPQMELNFPLTHGVGVSTKPFPFTPFLDQPISNVTVKDLLTTADVVPDRPNRNGDDFSKAKQFPTEEYKMTRVGDSFEAVRVPMNGTTNPDPTASTPTKEKLPDGQYADHWVLSDEERAKGFVRPVRHTYKHTVCGHTTTMPQSIAESYAANPKFYGRTFCANCHEYFPVGAGGEFVWEGTEERVGT